MLAEVSVLVPANISNDVCGYADSRACLLFGGCTWGPVVRGRWRNPAGDVESDTMRTLTIAVDSFGDLALVVAFARELGKRAGEHSMYVSALGVSEIVECGGVS